jgi:hypothetical protein
MRNRLLRLARSARNVKATRDLRRLVALVGAVSAAFASAACSSSEPQGSASSGRQSSATPLANLTAHDQPIPRLKVGTPFVRDDLAPGPIAVDPGHLVWMMGSFEGEYGIDVLTQLDLKTGRRATLDRDVNRGFGLASTSGWVVYAKNMGRVSLVAVRHDGTKRTVLTRVLATAVASRGELVAWGEERGSTQRVIVRDMAKGVQWLAATLPRCEHHRCYRLDAVTLAERGVAFTRGAIGPQPSIVMRRAFSERRPTALKLAGDPQPDLVPSSSGALFYAFQRGWYRWDFGTRRPSVRRLAVPGATLIASAAGRSFALVHTGCRTRLFSWLGEGRPVDVTTPAHLIGIAKMPTETCVGFGGLVWTGKQAVTAWALIPPESAEAHSDEGTVGIILVGPPLEH